MAAIYWFDQALVDLGNKIHDMDGDTLKLALITSATTPAKTTAAPHYGGTGTTNMATNAVATGTAWTGPVTLASTSWSLTGSTVIFKATDVAISQDGSGFTNARWGIIYNDTDVNKRCIGYVDLDSDRSIVTGSLTIDFQGSGTDILQIAN